LMMMSDETGKAPYEIAMEIKGHNIR